MDKIARSLFSPLLLFLSYLCFILLNAYVAEAHESVHALEVMKTLSSTDEILPTLPCGRALSTDCRNKMCRYQYNFYTCAEFGVRMTPTCAEYILGFFYDCPIFPSPDELINSPYQCQLELERLAPNLRLAIPGYIRSKSSDLCRRQCSSDFISSGIDLYGSCGAEIAKANASCRLTSVFNGFQELRGTQCAVNNLGRNCYDVTSSSIQEIMGNTSIPPVITPPAVDYTCASLTIGKPSPKLVPGTCQAFTSTGCCSANQQTLHLQQSFGQFYPPCLTRFLSINCRTGVNVYNPQILCNNGSMLDVSVISASIYMASPKLPNMQNNISTFTLLKIIGMSLVPVLSVQQISLVNYTYFDATGTPTSSSDGFPSVGNTEYIRAVSGRFHFQITISSTGFSGNNQTAQTAAINSYISQIKMRLPMAVRSPTTYAATASSTSVTSSNLFLAEPFDLPPVEVSSASQLFLHGCLASLVLSLSLYFILL